MQITKKFIKEKIKVVRSELVELNEKVILCQRELRNSESPYHDRQLKLNLAKASNNWYKKLGQDELLMTLITM